MSPRSRKFIGTFAMVAFVLFYVLMVMGLAPAVLRDANALGQFAFYLVAGIGWAFPLMPLIKWMERKPPGAGGRSTPR